MPESSTMTQAQTASPLYLAGVESGSKPGVYRSLIDAAKARDAEHPKIWNLFSFGEPFTVHLARFTEGVIRTPASLPVAMRELIAAATSYSNDCQFCAKAHASAAAELLGSEELVWSALYDLETSALPEPDKALLRFTNKVTKSLPSITEDDIVTVRAAGWDDEAIYYAITTCALFNFYNRWITATGVPAMSMESHRLQGQMIARRGYIREENK